MASTFRPPTEFATRLREALQKLGMTQQQAADATGITLRSMKNYALGNTIPDASILKAICGGLELAPRWMLFGTGPMRTAEGAAEFDLSEAILPPGFEVAGRLDASRREWLRAAAWVQHQIQLRDQSDVLFQKVQNNGMRAEVLEKVAAEKRKLEAIEREVLIAFCEAGSFDLSLLPGMKKEAPRPGRRRRRRIPDSIKNRAYYWPPVEGEADNERKEHGVPPRLAAALRKYESAWQAVLQQVDGQ
jgi:transcriptional regulator with XRE-family HTH domain